MKIYIKPTKKKNYDGYRIFEVGKFDGVNYTKKTETDAIRLGNYRIDLSDEGVFTIHGGMKGEVSIEDLDYPSIEITYN